MPVPSISNVALTDELPIDPRCAEVVDVHGVPIRWGIVGRTDGAQIGDLVLVHGLRANHYWWDEVVPALADKYRIIWLDLAGNGASGHRAEYSAELWSDDVIGALDAAESERAVIVGHSLGGRVSMVTAARHPHRFVGMVLLDSKVWARNSVDRPQRRPDRERVFAAREDAIERFRLAPPQPMSEDLRARIAEYSIRPHPEGWSWRFDQTGMPPIAGPEINEYFEQLQIPVDYIYGTASTLVESDAAEVFRASVPAEVRIHKIEGGHHHLTLDHPAESAQLIDDAARRFFALESRSDT